MIMINRLIALLIGACCVLLTKGHPHQGNELVDQPDQAPIPIEAYETNMQIERQQRSRSANCPPQVCNDDCLIRNRTSEGCEICGACLTNGYFEGDIEVDERSIDTVMQRYSRQSRGAARTRKWEKKGELVHVPYTFLASVGTSKRKNIKKAIEQYDALTCIRFVPRNGERDYIAFHGTGGCSSHVGKVGGGQPVRIGKNCDIKQGTILHELMHAIGFFHEQSRGDRDNYVNIHTNNIQSGYAGNFKKQVDSWESSLNSPYDFGSVMHYGGYFFSISYGSKPTITRKDNNEPVKEQREYFSVEDVNQINKLYNCKGYAPITGFPTTPAPITTKPPCVDIQTLRNCNLWKNEEKLCGRNKHVDKNCVKTCTGCQGTATTSRALTTTQRTTTTSTTTKPSVSTRCVDLEPRCSSWKEKGYCKSIDYVQRNCRSTCFNCRSPTTRPSPATTTATATPPTTATVTSGECKDKEKSCRHWKGEGYCTKTYVNYMKENCPSSCGYCKTTPKPGCVNNFKHCDDWAGKNYCTQGSFKDFMMRNCKKSCMEKGVLKTCDESTTTPANTTTVPICKDDSTNCGYWEGLGYCKSGQYLNYMQKNCKRSCGRCGGTITATTSRSRIGVPGYHGTCGITAIDLRYSMIMQRIVGGSRSTYGSIPWMVSLRRYKDFDVCGATLISDRHVVTAAHCFYHDGKIYSNPKHYFAYLGKHHRKGSDLDEGQMNVTFSSITLHSGYNVANDDHDIAVLTLSEPVSFTKYIRPACLPQQDQEPTIGAVGLVSGWGETQTGLITSVLQKVDVNIFSKEICNAWFKETTGRKDLITDNMFCAGHQGGKKDSCQGDSGGPLVVKVGGIHVLTGVVSWGYGCAKEKSPGVYTKVSKHIVWINQVMQSG